MKQFSRRSFLHRAGIGAAITLSLPSFMAAQKSNPVHYKGKKLNIALCGLGRYATYLAEGIEIAQFCRLAGIVTGTPAKAQAWQKKYNIPDANIYNYEDFDNVVSNKSIDLVYVVLPNSMHKEFVIRAARAGKHVIVEKPMAITAQDCKEMIAACEAAGVQLAMGYRLHYEPYNMEIKRLGQEKIFGQVRLIEVSLGYKTENPNEWRLKKAMAGGGPLMNLGIYCVQCSRYVLGKEPIAVTAQFGPVTQPDLFSEVEESITWQLVFPDGAVATSTTSNNCNVDRFYASADNGFFELSPAISYGPFKGRTSNGPLNFSTINQQQVQCDEIARLLLENKKLPEHISGKEGMQDMKIIEVIYKAAEIGKKVLLHG